MCHLILRIPGQACCNCCMAGTSCDSHNFRLIMYSYHTFHGSLSGKKGKHSINEYCNMTQAQGMTCMLVPMEVQLEPQMLDCYNYITEPVQSLITNF